MGARDAAGLSGIVGFAVAGGRSRRMNRDKAALPWGDGDLLDHALTRLAALTPHVRILCGPQARYADRGRPAVVDTEADIGGLAALVTALRAIRADETAVLLAVDLPLVSSAQLQDLLDLAPGFDAVVPQSAAGPEPFAAVYRATCRPAVERAVADGRLKMTSFWNDVRVRAVPAAELGGSHASEGAFCNVNTPEDYERARRLAGA